MVLNQRKNTKINNRRTVTSESNTNNTIQDRLVTDFKLNKIKTFIFKEIYNKKFSVKAENEENYLEPVPSYIALDLLLSRKLTRKIDSSRGFTIKNKKFQILNNNIMLKNKVNIYISKKIGIIAEYNNTKYKVSCLIIFIFNIILSFG